MNLLSTPRGRAFVYTALYFSEGAPIGFVWWAMPTMLRVRGLPVEEITALTALVLLPWMLKFAWAPLVDVLRTPRWTTRSWVVSAQSLMALSILPLAWLDPVAHFWTFRVVLLVHAVAAATQDAAVDRLAISTVPDGERGRINGYMQGGMLTARSLFGGVSLVVAGSLGWTPVILAMAGCILVTLTLVLSVREPDAAPTGALSVRAGDFLSKVRDAARARATWAGLLFALVSAAGFEATGSLLGPFLIDSGYDQSHVGAFFGVPGIIATIGGGLLGGWLSDRTGLRVTLGASVAGFVAPIVALGAMGAGGTPYAVSPFVPMTVLYFFIGMFTASSYALFMRLTRPGLGATQFSTYMSATNACESWATWSGGRLTAQIGYGGAFIAMAAVSLASLILLPGLKGAVPRGPGSSRGQVGAGNAGG